MDENQDVLGRGVVPVDVLALAVFSFLACSICVINCERLCKPNVLDMATAFVSRQEMF